MSEEAWAQQYRNKQNFEWTLDTEVSSTIKIAHWAAFVTLSGCTIYLAAHAWNAKGPGGNSKYFYGYKEEMMLSIYVNLFAAVAYYGKVVADTHGHHYVNAGPVLPVMGNYAYMDYITTCPLLVYDLLGQLRAPYKTTCSVLIFLVLLTGVVTNFYEGEKFRGPAYAWFALGMVLFAVDYFLLYKIITQQYTKLETLSYQSHAKKALFPLKMAIGTFFVVWVFFPVIWLLSDRALGLINNDAVEVLHALCDIVAKSVYGFMLARFRTYFDKKLYATLEELGLDGEAEMEHLDKELAHAHVIHDSHGKEHHVSPIEAKLGSSLVRDPIDASGDIVQVVGSHKNNGVPPFQLTPRGDIQLTPRGEHRHSTSNYVTSDTPHNQLMPRSNGGMSPRRRSVLNMLSERSMNSAEWQRRKSEDEAMFALSNTAPLMRVHDPNPPISSSDSNVSKDARLAKIQKQMELINRELALASGSDGQAKKQKKKLQSDISIPSLYNDDDSDEEYERERRRRRKEKKERERRAREKQEASFKDRDSEDRGVC